MLYYIYDTPFGKMTIAADATAITHVLPEGKLNIDARREASSLTDMAAAELSEYFEGKRLDFSVPINPCGTEFQKKVWNALLNVPFGETKTYKDIAVAIGNEKACRAVGMANNKNPIWIIIPCHRIIGAGGNLTGYGGGLDMKQKLLELETHS
ncbi:MAG: methylated-DNA--[protein]-cysteine S-methyltransferase [Oscillospiraceae bacterium]|nr:methylated-DNA--[protein]-cysteine S-methyltransferase [Oscillospiraceae bacterium]MCL2279178.1 methylated-DNA--[protein]-cysteine S-methyltransferase [Oscillospiraceae bacterium]